MKARFSTALGVALLLASACGESPSPAIVAPVQPTPRGTEATSTPPPPASPAAAPSASSPASPPPVASAPPPPAPASAEPALEPELASPPPNCKTVNDCWMDSDRKPIARPVKLRGKVIRPCKDGEHAPACLDGTCAVRHFKC